MKCVVYIGLCCIVRFDLCEKNLFRHIYSSYTNYKPILYGHCGWWGSTVGKVVALL